MQLLPADVAKLASGLTEGLAEIAAQPRPAAGTGGAARLHELELRLAEVERQLNSPPRGVAAAVSSVRSRLVSRGLRALVRHR